MRDRKPVAGHSRFKALVVLALSAALSSPAFASPITLERENYGRQWPYPKYSSALLDCKVKSFGGTRRPLVIIKLGATWYGLNGAAMGVGGFPDSRSQMARHPEWGTYELGASDEFVEKGLEICGWQ